MQIGNRVALMHKQFGFTYIGILITIAIVGIGLSATGPIWKKVVTREKEKQLLYAGNEISQAIASYYEHSPNGQKTPPKNLSALLKDERFPATKRHLRKIYLDPMTGSHDWGLVYNNEYLVGVYSQSSKAPIKQSRFPMTYRYFENSKSYQAWKFIPENLRNASYFK